MVLCKSTVSLWVFCLFDLTVTNRKVLQSPPIIVDLSVSPFGLDVNMFSISISS